MESLMIISDHDSKVTQELFSSYYLRDHLSYLFSDHKKTISYVISRSVLNSESSSWGQVSFEASCTPRYGKTSLNQWSRNIPKHHPCRISGSLDDHEGIIRFMYIHVNNIPQYSTDNQNSQDLCWLQKHRLLLFDVVIVLCGTNSAKEL